MNVDHFLTASVTAHGITEISAVQGDSARLIRAHLTNRADPWEVPEGVSAGISYELPDGTPGYYDQLQDGSAACAVAGNIVSVAIAPVLTANAGLVKASIVLRTADGIQLATFPLRIRVEKLPGLGHIDNMPAMGHGFEGRIFYGGPGGTVVPLSLGSGIRVERLDDGSLRLVAVGGGSGGGGVYFETDETLTLENGILSVNTADQAEADNTLPITSAAVYAQVGNIGAILETI